MDIKELKTYIYENSYVEKILEAVGCHHIQYHSGKGYWSCANKTGDNKSAVILYNNEHLGCINYTRNMVEGHRSTDIIDLVAYTEGINFVKSIKFICDEIGISYYKDFDEDIPESFKILKMLEAMNSGGDSEEDEKPLIPIDIAILRYYLPYVNDLFYNDGISYSTQQEFGIGYDPESNRITIPIYSELGDLVGVKGRLFKDKLDEEDLKYLYIMKCARSKILFGLNKTYEHIIRTGRVYVFESEKSVMQMWSYGYYNSVATGGKKLTNRQIEMLTRLGVEIVFCFDKDVAQAEIEEIADRFQDGVSIYAIYDIDDILDEKESPSDNVDKWKHLVDKNVYCVK